MQPPSENQWPESKALWTLGLGDVKGLCAASVRELAGESVFRLNAAQHLAAGRLLSVSSVLHIVQPHQQRLMWDANWSHNFAGAAHNFLTNS